MVFLNVSIWWWSTLRCKFDLKARAADEKLMVSASSPSPPGSSNDRVGLHVRDHQQSFRPGGRPHLSAQDGKSSAWASISWQLAAGAAALRMMRNSQSRWQGLMFDLGQLCLVWILSWPLTSAAEGCISSSSRLETADVVIKLHTFESQSEQCDQNCEMRFWDRCNNFRDCFTRAASRTFFNQFECRGLHSSFILKAQTKSNSGKTLRIYQWI